MYKKWWVGGGWAFYIFPNCLLQIAAKIPVHYKYGVRIFPNKATYMKKIQVHPTNYTPKEEVIPVVWINPIYDVAFLFFFPHPISCQ